MKRHHTMRKGRKQRWYDDGASKKKFSLCDMAGYHVSSFSFISNGMTLIKRNNILSFHLCSPFYRWIFQVDWLLMNTHFCAIIKTRNERNETRVLSRNIASHSLSKSQIDKNSAITSRFDLFSQRLFYSKDVLALSSQYSLRWMKRDHHCTQCIIERVTHDEPGFLSQKRFPPEIRMRVERPSS